MLRDNHVLKFGVYVYIEAWSMDHGPVPVFSIGTLWENSVDKKGFHQTHPNKEKKNGGNRDGQVKVQKGMCFLRKQHWEERQLQRCCS